MSGEFTVNEDEFRRFIKDYEVEIDIEVVDGQSYYCAWTHLLPDVTEYGDNIYEVVELMWYAVCITEDSLGQSLLQ